MNSGRERKYSVYGNLFKEMSGLVIVYGRAGRPFVNKLLIYDIDNTVLLMSRLARNDARKS